MVNIFDHYVADPGGGTNLVDQLVILLAAFLWHDVRWVERYALARCQALDRPVLVDLTVILEVIEDIDVGQRLASSVADRYDVWDGHSLIDDLRGGLLDLEMVLIDYLHRHAVACADGVTAGPTGNGGGVVKEVTIIAPGPVARDFYYLLEGPGVHASCHGRMGSHNPHRQPLGWPSGRYRHSHRTGSRA